MSAAGAGCPLAVHAAFVLPGFLILGLVIAVLGLAYSCPRSPRSRLFAGIDVVLAAGSVLVVGAGVVIDWTGHRDGCGELSPVVSAWTTVLVFGGIALMVVGWRGVRD
jgi:uncharacterized Zn-binding protein involved in type VI secretion